MASIPTPRSYNQILGDMIDALRSKLGVPSLPSGDPILSVLEAAAQSDLRSSQDVFQYLASVALDKATGDALERIGADDDLEKLAESPSSGFVDISDTSFVKTQSTIFQGLPAPIIGSAAINTVSAQDWPGTGSIYIGRGTNQYEGPLAYTSLVNNTSYWTINLAGGNHTQKFHNLGETVILAQGGDRQINAGTVVQTPQGNTGDSVQFSTLYSSTLLDGETDLSNITVVAKLPGIVGNVSAGSITAFSASPFTGAAVTNATPFTNGQAAEDDKAFRERIKNARQSRSKATPLAIKTAVTGATSTDENKRVISASVVTREGSPTTLYIDDGNGYEEQSEGVAYEQLTASALGGEQYFSLANGRPVAKAFLLSTFSAPFDLHSGDVIAVSVGGTVYQHGFSTNEFRSITNATAYEVVASINADSSVKFNARTANNGTQVAIFADDDTNEDVEVTTPTGGENDANLAFGIPVGKVDTLRLYKNDRLLNKDGSVASLASNPQSLWSSLSSGETLTIVVDGVDISGIANTYTINDIDFVNAGTLYTSVSATNSLDSWATVLNFKIPGITASVSSGFLSLVSNAGRTARASLSIQGGSLTSNNVFVLGSATGSDNDYTFNRNLGILRLEDNRILSVSDRLTAGSLFTRAFVESDSLGTVALLSNAELWFCVDGDAQIIKTSVSAGTSVVYSLTSSNAWGKRIRVTVSSAAFSNVTVGDWLITNDLGISGVNLGAYRIVTKDGGNTWIEIERASSYTGTGTFSLLTGGFKIVRTSTEPQRVTISSGNNYTALTLVNAINSQLVGGTASVYKTTKIRIATDTFDTTGDMALVVVNAEAEKLLLPTADAIDNLTSHLASIQAGNDQVGTPVFSETFVDTITSSTVLVTSQGFDSGNFIVATKPDDDGLGRWSNVGHISAIHDFNFGPGILTIRNAPLQEWLVNDEVYESSHYALSANDTFVALIDGDILSQRYAINMFRNVIPGSAVYGASNDFKDVDNASLSLAVGFGVDFEWNDFAVFMHARTKSNLSAGANTTKTILWRYYRYGYEGNDSRIQYRYPSVPNSLVQVLTNAFTDGATDMQVLLPSNAARTGTTIRSSTKIAAAATSVTASLYNYYYVLNLAISSASRTSNVDTLTLTLPGPITDHGIQIGDQVFVQSTSGSFASGVKVVTARSATTIQYTETAADSGAVANIGRVGEDTVGVPTINGSTVIAGDIFGIVAGTGIASPFAPNATKIKVLDTNGAYWQTTSDQVASVSTVLTWYSVADATKLSFFPINTGTNTATAITASINALVGAPVTAVAVGGGSGQISAATYETTGDGGEGAANPWYNLTDGINFVMTHNTPVSTSVDFNFTFKQNITATLAIDSDWANEKVRLVPLTAQNIVAYLNSTATSGLSSAAEIIVSADGQRPQISSLTPGSAGSVQIQGGSANFLSSATKNSGAAVGGTMVVSFPATDLDGLGGTMYVALENSNTVPKIGRITSSTSLSSLDSNGNFVLSGTTAWDYSSGSSPVTDNWQFIKQGKYIQVRALTQTFTGVAEGDIAVIKMSSGTTANDGTFRVIRQVNDNWFWIENSNAFEDIQPGSIAFLQYDSILPGDVLSINTSLWSNIGNFVVETIDLPAPFGGSNNQYTFKVQSVTTPVTGPITLGSQSNLVQVIEGLASKLIKRVIAISPNASDSTAADVKFDTSQGYQKVGAFAGTVMIPVDKLNFSTDIAQGIDAYQHNTGLLAEANKIVYGDESDPSTYPGYVAAGAKVNISGPLIKRIQLSIGVRLASSIGEDDVFDRVKSEVAAVVNQSPIGQSISISSIVDAAEGVNGVDAVSIISPTYSVASDLISVQPFEKPLILNVDTDVLVSLVGE
jgi:hypothetical protein